MLFTQQFQLPDNGRIRVGTIGGEPYLDRDGHQYQIGYMVPPRLGIVHIDAVERDDPRALQCVASVEGYASRPIDDCRVPGRIVVELPCSVSVVGPPGTSLIVIAWEVTGFSERGGGRSSYAANPILGAPVPLWAHSFDYSGEGGLLTFRDPFGSVVGAFSAPLVAFSVPDRAATFDLTAGETLVFRQQ